MKKFLIAAMLVGVGLGVSGCFQTTSVVPWIGSKIPDSHLKREVEKFTTKPVDPSGLSCNNANPQYGYCK